MNDNKAQKIAKKIEQVKKEIKEMEKDLNSRESAAATCGGKIVTGEFFGSARFLRDRIYNLSRELIRLKAGLI